MENVCGAIIYEYKYYGNATEKTKLYTEQYTHHSHTTIYYYYTIHITYSSPTECMFKYSRKIDKI